MFEDRLLVWKVKGGSTDALRRLYEKYSTYLLTVAANLVNEKSDAEDVVQDVFIGFIESVGEFRLKGSLKAYLAVCAANRSRDLLRKKRRQRANPLETAEHKAANTEGPVRLAERSEELLRLAGALCQLPDEQRQAVVLRIHAGLKFKHIAACQQTSVKTAISRYRYGLERLRTLLNSEVTK
jgi:RNA polymerase sigma-70 factor (ECF subfamily)